MTKYEVKNELSKYYALCCEIECLKKRIDRLKESNHCVDTIKTRVEELTEQYNNTMLESDIALARALEIINQLSNTDCDVEVLKKYHIDGLSEREIAKQLCFSVDYIRTKRWRAYEKISKKESLK